MKSLLNKTIALATVLSLSSCEQLFEPVHGQLNPAQSFQLKSDQNKPVDFVANNATHAVFEYDTSNSRIVMKIGQQRVLFKGAKVSSDKTTVNSDFSTSGQVTETGAPVSCQISRKLLDTDSRVERDYVSCTWYERVPRTVCHTRPDGSVDCHTYYDNIPRPGRQFMEITTTTSTYEYTGTVNSTQGLLADLGATRSEVSVRRNPLGACY